MVAGVAVSVCQGCRYAYVSVGVAMTGDTFVAQGLVVVSMGRREVPSFDKQGFHSEDHHRYEQEYHRGYQCDNEYRA